MNLSEALPQRLIQIQGIHSNLCMDNTWTSKGYAIARSSVANSRTASRSWAFSCGPRGQQKHIWCSLCPWTSCSVNSRRSDRARPGWPPPSALTPPAARAPRLASLQESRAPRLQLQPKRSKGWRGRRRRVGQGLATPSQCIHGRGVPRLVLGPPASCAL